MKTYIATLILATFLLQGTPVIAGTATLNATGNWSDGTKWSGGFAPINGNNGDPSWSATVNANTVTVDATTIIQALSFGGGTINGANILTMNAASQWNAGTFATSGGVTNFNAGLSMTANGQTIDARTVNLAGTGANASGIGAGTLNVNNGGTLANSGDFVIFTNLSPLSISSSGGGTLSNSGTINKSGANSASFHAAFNNTGVLNVDAGTIFSSGGGTSTGIFDIDNGARFRVSLGSYTMNGGVQVDGTGTGIFDVAGGTVTFNGTSTGSTGKLGIVGGTMTFDALADFTTSGGFTGSSGTLNGAGTVTFGGASTWGAANLSGAGTTNFNGGVAITAGQTIDQRTVNMAGTSSIGSGTIGFTNGGTLANSGTFNISNSSGLTFNNIGAGTVSNTGTINKSGAGTATDFVVFNNAGTLNVTAGTFVANTTVTQHSGTTLTGGTWNVSGGGTLTFSTGSNLTTIGSSASVSLDGATSTFNRLGSVTASTLTTNQGSFTLKNDRDITTASAFSNSGTVSVQDSATVFKIGATGNLAYTQTGSTSVTILAGGAMIDSSAFNLNGGALRGTGTIDAPLTTSGTTTIAPGASPGTITINGSAILGSGNTLAMEVGGLAAGIDYDVLDVNGVITLAGLLDIDFINGFETSVTSFDVFTIATADSPILGAFSNVASGSRIGTNTFISFDVWYGADSPFGANNLVLTGAPEPSRALLLLAGLAGVTMRRRRLQVPTVDQR